MYLFTKLNVKMEKTLEEIFVEEASKHPKSKISGLSAEEMFFIASQVGLSAAKIYSEQQTAYLREKIESLTKQLEEKTKSNENIETVEKCCCLPVWNCNKELECYNGKKCRLDDVEAYADKYKKDIHTDEDMLIPFPPNNYPCRDGREIKTWMNGYESALRDKLTNK